MLGWALKKGFQGATGFRDAPQGGEDTTQFDAPDTPAPVFAARAIKNAIWGQSTAAEAPPTKMKPNDTERVAKPASDAAAPSQANLPDTRSPTKLNSILLTPGTGTSRRKRVSFGRDVKAANNVNSDPLASSSAQNGGLRKKTTLQQALENSRPTKPRAPEPQAEQPEDDDTDEDWEWEDEDVCCHHDMTVDLNEPHSESGKYWKAEWTRYREEAKSDIEQLVKYKANAKSFAAKKDMEASRLSQQLKEEQAKVADMEKKVANMTTKLAAIRKHGTDKDNALMTEDLATQTALVAEYRGRIKDLESRLKEASSGSNTNRPNRQAIDTSPQTEQSIYEVSRELRKARSELRQLDALRDEVKRLKSALAISRERVAELEAQASTGDTVESSRVEKLEKQLREAKEGSRQKDMEIKKLQRDYESLKMDAKSRTAEAMQVLRDKNAKIDELEKKVKDMETANSLSHNSTTRDLKSDIESLGRPSRYEKAQSTNRRMRAASVEDISLDMTQRSLLRDRVDHQQNGIGRGKAYGGDLLTDWTADIPTFELQVKDTEKGREGTEKLNEQPIIGAIDPLLSRRAARRAEQQSLHDNHGGVPDVLSNRVNESSRRQARRRRQAEANSAFSTDRSEDNTSRRTASTRTASLTEDRATTRDALDQPTRRSRALPRVTRPMSPGSEAPTIDLLQDHFSRLGGPSADRSALANASRCTLPAERQAAARARLEQKRTERRKTSRQDLDKENVRP